jgi:hypothetical protein
MCACKAFALIELAVGGAWLFNAGKSATTADEKQLTNEQHAGNAE